MLRAKMELKLLFLIVLFFGSCALDAAQLTLGLGVDPLEGSFLADEWAWALRGGGVGFRQFTTDDLAAPAPDIPLIILDSVPLTRAASKGLDAWVKNGGLLVYAGAPAALQEIAPDGQILTRREVIAPELFGLRFAGLDPGLVGTYPDIVESSALLSPLLPGDGLRLGLAGIGHKVRFETAGAQVLARSAFLSPGSDGMVLASDAPTIFAHRHGKGKVVFLAFSPGQVATCYPEYRQSREPTDCSGASSAHALMRWLTANLLWEERRLQIPLLFEAPGDHPHAFIVTGDVHDRVDGVEIKWAVQMTQILNSLNLPLSLYLVGRIVENTPADFEALREFKNLEIATHSARGQPYMASKFSPLGALGILSDIRKAEALVGQPAYPTERHWFVSTRNESFKSDEGAWKAMHRAGIGLVFDQVADRLRYDQAWKVGEMWFDGGEQRRLFVPIYERSVTTGMRPFPVGSYRLSQEQQRDIALLGSAQPEPCCHPLPYRKYSEYIQRWHNLFARLAKVGGLTEVWLWHPGGVGGRNAFGEMERTLRSIQGEASVQFVRGDVAASWRANRERLSVRPERDSRGAIKKIQLLPPGAPLVALPPGAPPVAATTSYWVIGPLVVPGWSSRHWTDALGRTMTVLVHSLSQGAAK